MDEAAELMIVARARDEATGAMRQVEGGLKGMLGNVTTLAMGFGAAQMGVQLFQQGIGMAKGSIIDMNASIEKSTLQFTTLMKDSDRASQHVKNLFEFAKETPFEAEPVIRASRLLQTFGGDALNTMDNLRLFGDAAAGASADIGEVSFWVGRAYSAIKGGQPFGEAAMRLQELALLTPETRQEMERLQKTGADSSQVWELLQNDLKRFNGAMALQAKTWGGLTSTLSDTIGITSAQIFKPVFDAAKAAVGALIDILASPAFTKAAQFLTDVLAGAFDALGNVLGQLGPVVGSALGTIGDWLGIVGGKIEQWAPYMQAAFELVQAGLGTLADVFSGVFSGIFEVVGTIGQAIYDALQWINPFAAHSKPLVDSVEDGVEAIRDAFGNLITVVPMLEDVGTAVEDLSTTVIKQGSTLEQAKDAMEAYKEQVAASKETVDSLSSDIKDLDGVIQRLSGTQLQGTQEFKDKLFAIDQETAKVQLSLNRMKLSGAPKESMKDLENQLASLNLQAEGLRLEEKIRFDPLKRQVEGLVKPLEELPFDEVVEGIRSAQTAQGELNEKLKPAIILYQQQAAAMKEGEKQLKDMEKVAQAAKAAEGAAKAAHGAAKSMGDSMAAAKGPIEAIKKPLDDAKEKIEEWRQKVEGAKTAISDFLAPAAGWARTLQDSLSAAFGFGNFESLSTLFGDLGGRIGTWISNGITSVGDLGGQIGSWIGKQLGSAGSFIGSISWSGLWGDFTKLRESFVSWLGDLGGNVISWLGEQWGKIEWSAIWGDFTKLTVGFATWVGDLAGTIKTWIGYEWSKIDWKKSFGDFERFRSDFGEWLGDVKVQLENWQKREWKTIDWKSVFDSIPKPFSQFSSWIDQWDWVEVGISIGKFLFHILREGVSLLVKALGPAKEGGGEFSVDFALIQSALSLAFEWSLIGILAKITLTLRKIGVGIMIGIGQGALEAIGDLAGLLGTAIGDALERGRAGNPKGYQQYNPNQDVGGSSRGVQALALGDARNMLAQSAFGRGTTNVTFAMSGVSFRDRSDIDYFLTEASRRIGGRSNMNARFGGLSS